MVLLSSASGFATLLTVVNPSFEADVPPDPIVSPWREGEAGKWTSGLITGWNIGTSNYAGTLWPSAVIYPYGTPSPAVAWNNGTNISQVLTDNLTANMAYTLTVWVGHRYDISFPGYGVQLLAGGTVIAEDVNSFVPDAGYFLPSIVQYTVLPEDPYIGQPLSIRLVGLSGGQVSFDEVTLDATHVPVPGALVLLGSGLLGLGTWRRLRRG